MLGVQKGVASHCETGGAVYIYSIDGGKEGECVLKL